MSSPLTGDLSFKISALKEALPYVQKFSGEVFVVKYGGSAMGDDATLAVFASDVQLLKSCGINVIVVHGGGPQISKMLDKLGHQTKFIDGIRVTNKEAVDIVEMVLCGSINKKIVSAINAAGGMAIGMSGKDANLFSAVKATKTSKETDSNIERILDLGYVGRPTRLNTEILDVFNDGPVIPVIAPVGYDDLGNTYNINADVVAGFIAGELKANKLILLTDVDGIMDDDKLFSVLSISDARRMIERGTITGGMIPKVETCIDSLEKGVSSVHIINGNTQDALIVEILTKSGIGTMIVNDGGEKCFEFGED